VIYATGNIITAGNFQGNLAASYVTSGVFGSGNFAFPVSLGVATSSQVGLPQSLSVYGGGYFSGNVGIGTTGPGSKLEVNGSIATKAGPGTPAFAMVGDIATANWITSNGSYRLNFYNDSSGGDLGLGTISAYSTTWYPKVAFTQGGGAYFGGNVGIGTTAPSAKLSILGNQTTYNFLLNSFDTTAGQRSTAIASGPSNSIFTGSNKPGNLATVEHAVILSNYGGVEPNNNSFRVTVAYTDANNGIFTAPSYTDALVVRASGKVGIGTASPSNVLQVSGANTSQVGIDIANTSAGGVNWRLQSVGSGATGRIGNFELWNASTSILALAIQPGGNVGIGTTTPTAGLQIVSVPGNGVSPKLRLTDNTLGGKTWEIQSGIAGVNDSYFGIWDVTDNVQAVTITNSGNVGIGTTGPGQKLSVAGTIESTSGGFKFPDGTVQQTTASLPSGMVAFFNLSTCPTGWTELTSARGRYIVGLPLSGTLAGTQGTALTDLENRPTGAHTHQGMWARNDQGGSPGQVTTSTGGASVLLNTANVSVQQSPLTGGTPVAGTNAPYIQLLVCQKT
jgi:hypothetical protein